VGRRGKSASPCSTERTARVGVTVLKKWEGGVNLRAHAPRSGLRVWHSPQRHCAISPWKPCTTANNGAAAGARHSPQPQSISPAGLSPASRANVPNAPNQQPKHPPFCARHQLDPVSWPANFQQGPSLCYLPNTTWLVVFRAAAFSLPIRVGWLGYM
jgi:hypothetical protein